MSKLAVIRRVGAALAQGDDVIGMYLFTDTKLIATDCTPRVTTEDVKQRLTNTSPLPGLELLLP